MQCYIYPLTVIHLRIRHQCGCCFSILEEIEQMQVNGASGDVPIMDKRLTPVNCILVEPAFSLNCLSARHPLAHSLTATQTKLSQSFTPQYTACMHPQTHPLWYSRPRALMPSAAAEKQYDPVPLPRSARQSLAKLAPRMHDRAKSCARFTCMSESAP